MSNYNFVDNTDEILKALRSFEHRALTRCGQAAEGYAKDLSPVGTPESTGIAGYIGGTLKNSITYKILPSENLLYVGTRVEYAPFVELGTVKKGARPFIKPALTDYKLTYRNIMLDEGQNL